MIHHRWNRSVHRIQANQEAVTTLKDVLVELTRRDLYTEFPTRDSDPENRESVPYFQGVRIQRKLPSWRCLAPGK